MAKLFLSETAELLVNRCLKAVRESQYINPIALRTAILSAVGLISLDLLLESLNLLNNRC